MKREQKLNAIYTQFDKSARSFCERTKGIYCDVTREYKGEEVPQNITYLFAKIYYRSFAIKFIYTAHGMLSTVNSILECSVCLDKNDDSTEMPLSLLMDYCNMITSTPLSIPFITDVTAMVEAFQCIGSVLEDLFTELNEMLSKPGHKEKVLQLFHNEMKYVFKLEDESENFEDMNEVFREFFTLRFTSNAFINAIKGNYTKAVKQLRKIKRLTGYEKQMLSLWRVKEQGVTADLSVIIENAEMYNEHGVQKADFKEFGAMFFSWIVLTPAIAIVYLGLYFLIVHFEGWKSVYLMGPIYNFPICIMFGFITAIGTSYFTRLKFYKIFYKKDYEKYCEMDYIQNGGSADRLMKRFLIALIVISIVGCGLLAKWNLNFLNHGFIDNSKFFSIHGEYHSYSEIERIYYKPDRVNDFGDVLDFPSYVIVLKSGVEIDLYEHGEITDYEHELLDYLKSIGVEIVCHING